jgi:hypothetical protein
MAYNYIGLTNEVNRRLNEVELTSTNFGSASGFYSQIKDSVNAALRDIYDAGQDWPFNHVINEDTLDVGVSRYAFPADASTIDFDTFRIKADETLGNTTVKLTVMQYEEYLEKAVDQEYSTDTSKRTIPKNIVQAPSLEWVVVPAPDQAYEIVYEYYQVPADLVSATDVPTVPERFRHVIIDGAMYHAYMFRSNEQAAKLAEDKFKEGIKRMRSMLINRVSYMRATAINQSSFSAFGERVK